MNITLEKYIKILDAGYSLDILYILKLIKEKVDISQEILHPKLGAIHQMLLRKGLATDEWKVTMDGDTLLDYLEEDGEKLKEIVKKVKTEGFDKWWLTYCPTNHFVYKNKVFSGTQSKRIKKDDCKKLFQKIVNEGISAEDIIGATEYHFQVAKDLSFKHGKNEISFIGNSFRYLNERMFAPYIDMYKSKIKTTETALSNAVDI